MTAHVDVVILAAGQGKRMHSALPKVLQPLAGRPLLEGVRDRFAERAARDGRAIHVTDGDVTLIADPSRAPMSRRSIASKSWMNRKLRPSSCQTNPLRRRFRPSTWSAGSRAGPGPSRGWPRRSTPVSICLPAD